MPSQKKTKNLKLNQWQSNEYPKMEDFNEDNQKIDDAFGNIEQKVTEGVENLDVSEKQIEFAEAATRILPKTGDALKVIVSKLTKFLSDLKKVAFTGKYSDLTGIPASFPPSAHNHDDRYLGKREKAESAKRADVATTAEQVQGFEFRNQDGKLEVKVEGKWIPVGGRQYTKLHYFSSKVLPEWEDGLIGRYKNGSEIHPEIIFTICDIKNNAGIVRNLSIYNKLEILELYVDGVRITKNNFTTSTSSNGLLTGHQGGGILLTHKQNDYVVYSSNVIEFSNSLKIIGYLQEGKINGIYGRYSMIVATEK